MTSQEKDIQDRINSLTEELEKERLLLKEVQKRASSDLLEQEYSALPVGGYFKLDNYVFHSDDIRLGGTAINMFCKKSYYVFISRDEDGIRVSVDSNTQKDKHYYQPQLGQKIEVLTHDQFYEFVSKFDSLTSEIEKSFDLNFGILERIGK